MLLEARHLQFAYRPDVSRRQTRAQDASRDEAGHAIADVSLALPAGGIVGVLGPNGSGKTTLIKLLSGALTPTRGAVSLDGRPLTGFTRAALARRIAVVPQETHLAFDYTVLEIVLMGRYPRLSAFQIEGPDDIAAAYDGLAATGTDALAERAFPTLSGGEKQRVIIASALAQLDDTRPSNLQAEGDAPPESSLLFLDEPTASLDLRYQLELASLLTSLNQRRGITMLLSTHDLSLARSICTHVVLLARGRVLAEGVPAEVVTPDLIGQLYDMAPALVAPVLR